MICREITDLYGPQLRPGTALVLKELPIIGPLGPKNPPFVTINANNIVSIFWNDEFGIQSNRVITFSSELLNNLHKQIEKDNKKALAAASNSYLASMSSSSIISSVGAPSPRPNYQPRPNFPGSQQRFPGPQQKFSGPQQRFSGPQRRFPGPQNGSPGSQQRFQGSQNGPPVYQQRFSGPQSRPPAPQQSFPGSQNRPPGHQPDCSSPQNRPPMVQKNPPITMERPQVPQTSTNSASVSAPDSVSEMLDDLDEDSIFGDF